MAKSIRDVLAEFREHSLDERDKGARFEQLMKDFLQNDTQYQRLFEEVWLWSEYPERGNRPDTGIDLVARERDTGELVAIQCKFYAPDALISKPDIDSFLASSSKAEFKGRMFISTSDNWGKNAEEAIAGQKPEVARIGLTDLDESSIDWSKFSFQSPQNLEKKPRKTPRPHQEEAIKNVLAGFKEADRGKLIMACGTGKTFTSLKLVERMFPNGGKVLFLVPSISLLSQALKEWTIESEASLRSYAVCSDVSVGKRKNDEDLPVTDLAFPATTNTERLVEKFTDAGPNQNGLTVIFSTYQSIDVVAQAQPRGIPEFDLIVCDEAHRTTGVTLSGDDESAFVKVHNQGFIKGKKRLYMTATPKVFSDASSKKAEDAGAVLADMGKPEMFGEEFHRLGFGEAVERGILTDYKVLVLAVDEAYVARRFQRQFADDDNELKLEDAAKIVGCWNGLSKRSTAQEEFQIDPGSMKRAVAFARSIAESKKIASMFQAVVDEETAQLDDDEAEYLRCEVEHVDGSFNSLRRNEKLDWLRQEVPDNTARILSNARCLTEGVDVPALDAVMFLNPRDSQVDVVQAVGRVMRKLEGKKYGYVILPIGVPADMDPATALNDNKKYKVVWQVLQALRSHDERFDAMVNKIDLTKKAPQIGIIGVGGGADGNGKDENGSVTLDFPNFDQWRDAILAKIVQKVGDKRYWENWASDIAQIAEHQILRISELVSAENSPLRTKFARFHRGLQDNLNPSVSEQDAIEMLGQHFITRPILSALFDGHDFVSRNPVSLVMQDMLDALEGQNLSSETETLAEFYDSVKNRASGITDPSAKQRILKQLYEEFFRKAFRDASDRLGIVYTPIEVVDFILKSANDILSGSFQSSLSAEGVHVLDPFTGTGTFLARLLQLGLVAPEALKRKFKTELHANELVLLAYYVAAINIEEAFVSISGEDYEPFEGIVLTDTFQMHEKDDRLDGMKVFPENNDRVVRQKSLDIRVVVGNPPYSVGAANENTAAKNLKYPTLDSRIEETYADASASGLKRNLYDSYVRAIRWASDRVGQEGMVCFVSNGSFLDSGSGDGIRKTLTREFSEIYVVNLRGNARTYGEVRRKEGDNVFGQGARTPVAIYFLVKRSDSPSAQTIHYWDIGDYLKKEEKLHILSEVGSFKNVTWQTLVPNEHGDWLEDRDEKYKDLTVIGESSKTAQGQRRVFLQHSLGMVTSRDSWLTNYSKQALAANVKSTIDFYNAEVTRGATSATANMDQSRISWSRGLKARLDRKQTLDFNPDGLREILYRPFVKTFGYFDASLIEMPSRLMQLFPDEDLGNPSILVSGPSNTGDFGCLMTNVPPSFDALSKTQVFGRYTFEADNSLGLSLGDEVIENGYRRIDNISPDFVSYVGGLLKRDVSSDEVFDYVYGVMHSREFRERFAVDLRKSMARIPVSANFAEFASTGEALRLMHLSFEELTPQSLVVEGTPDGDSHITKMRIHSDGDGFVAVELNASVTVRKIPARVLEYRLGPRSPLEWVVERYQVQVDGQSGLRNDPNAWSKARGPEDYFVGLLGRIVELSLQTLDLVEGLPPLEILD